MTTMMALIFFSMGMYMMGFVTCYVALNRSCKHDIKYIIRGALIHLAKKVK